MAAARLTVGIGGLGAIGWQVAAALDAGIPGLELAAVAARDEARAAARVAGLARPVPVMPAEALAEAADVVVECAPAAVFDRIARPAVAAGRLLMVLSCGQLLDRQRRKRLQPVPRVVGAPLGPPHRGHQVEVVASGADRQ